MLPNLLTQTLSYRQPLLTEPHFSGIRLFNGFYEGCPDLVVDLYAATLVLFNYADPPEAGDGLIAEAQAALLERLPWVRAVLVKRRRSSLPAERQGTLVYGERVDRKVRENGAWYALNLALHQDASLYLDARNLRAWLQREAQGLSVLNTFAYTGSLGAACLAGGAARVVQADLERAFLNLGKDTYSLNGFPVVKSDFIQADFFHLAARLRREGQAFDLALLDPPFFSATPAGRVDLVGETARLINKLRPLVKDGGRLVAVNNALFVSGEKFIGLLKELGADGYLAVEELIDVPEDVTGYPQTRVTPPPADPSPFNHPTKIAVLRVKKKDVPRGIQSS